MLKVKNISKSYNKKQILNQVSFTIGASTINAIVGENGAGKSTLLRIIIGELKSNHGSVDIKGKIGYCPQEPLVFSMLTVKENLHYFASAYGLVSKSNNDAWTMQCNKLLHQLGLGVYLHHRVDKLSGGTRQKLNFSISLLHDPDILILDEPYVGFDWETYQHFWEVILNLKAQGKSILLVTHLLNDLHPFDNIFTLKKGKII